jgi:hypothetical protein
VNGVLRNRTYTRGRGIDDDSAHTDEAIGLRIAGHFADQVAGAGEVLAAIVFSL